MIRKCGKLNRFFTSQSSSKRYVRKHHTFMASVAGTKVMIPTRCSKGLTTFDFTDSCNSKWPIYKRSDPQCVKINTNILYLSFY